MYINTIDGGCMEASSLRHPTWFTRGLFRGVGAANEDIHLNWEICCEVDGKDPVKALITRRVIATSDDLLSLF
jgi:hypothetical protein